MANQMGQCGRQPYLSWLQGRGLQTYPRTPPLHWPPFLWRWSAQHPGNRRARVSDSPSELCPASPCPSHSCALHVRAWEHPPACSTRTAHGAGRALVLLHCSEKGLDSPWLPSRPPQLWARRSSRLLASAWSSSRHRHPRRPVTQTRASTPGVALQQWQSALLLQLLLVQRQAAGDGFYLKESMNISTFWQQSPRIRHHFY